MRSDDVVLRRSESAAVTSEALGRGREGIVYKGRLVTGRVVYRGG